MGIMYLVVFVIILIMFFFVMIENKRTEKKMDENHFTVRQSKIFLLVGILGTLVGCVMLVLVTLFPSGTADLWIYGIFIFYTIMCLYLFVYCLSWKIRVDDDQIMYSPFIGINKNFTISSITRVKVRYGELKVYSGNKKLFAVASMANGHKVIAARLQKEPHIQFDF